MDKESLEKYRMGGGVGCHSYTGSKATKILETTGACGWEVEKGQAGELCQCEPGMNVSVEGKGVLGGGGKAGVTF